MEIKITWPAYLAEIC